ncbi:MAG TPA: response regulator transcription factor [Patescibacteria group bacterium]|nr:response regulator transcription factor [Patescibacteria group bacterium]
MDNKERLHVVIIDDEEHSRETLASLLREFCPSVQIEATVTSITDARRAILQYAPDAVFLDVELPPEGSGFDLLESIHPSFLRFAVVFTTGHSEYAAQAIRTQAVDFLTKPVDIDELQEAVTKLHEYKRTKRLEEAGANVLSLLKNISELQPKGLRMMFPTSTGLRIVHSSEVAYIAIMPNETEVRFANGELFTASISLNSRRQDILDNGFVQIGNEGYANTAHIQYFVEREGSKVAFKNGHSVPVESAYKDELLQYLKL